MYKKSSQAPFAKQIMVTLLGAGFMLSSPLAFAAKAPQEELDKITAVANTKGYIPIVVSFNVDNSLSALSKDAKGIAAKSKKMEDQLLSVLGKSVIRSTINRNGVGQTELYVTKTALPILEANANVVSYWLNDVIDMRRSVGTKEDIDEIEAEILAKGYADVEAVLNIDNYDLGDSKESIPALASTLSKINLAENTSRLAAQAQELLSAIPAFYASLPKSGVSKQPAFETSLQVAGKIAADALKGTQVLRITQEGLYALQASNLIRNLRLAGSDAAKLAAPARLDADALNIAKQQGEVGVTISLRKIGNYTHFAQKLSATAKNQQNQIIKATFVDIFKAFEKDELISVKEYEGFDFVHARFTEKGIKRLYSAPHAAIAGVSAPRVGKLLTAVTGSGGTAEMIGAPIAWSFQNPDGSYADGRGVTIAVLDTGVHKDHNAFKDNQGRSRITLEACYGSGDSPFNSICLEKNSVTNDSPWGLIDSGLPLYAMGNGLPGLGNSSKCLWSDPTCEHGTQVAGVAAGVAPKATIASITVASNVSSPAGIKRQVIDVETEFALIALLNNRTSNNIVVNISSMFGGCTYINGTVSFPAGSIQQRMMTVIGQLVDAGIPVIAASGNIATTGVPFPACLPNVISVAASYPVSPANYPPNRKYIWDQSTFNNLVTFVAPGVDIRMPSIGPNGRADTTTMSTSSGTSFAAPHVAGLYALAKSTSVFRNAKVGDITNWFKGNTTAVWQKQGENKYVCYPNAIQVAPRPLNVGPCSNRVM